MISVIVPVFNRPDFIRCALDSVRKQSYRDWECLVVDDGSTDQTAQCIESFLSDTRFSYIYQNQLGVSAARNQGIKRAKGQYITFLDSDDVWHEQKLERQLQFMEKENWTVSQCREIWVRQGIRVNPPHYCEKKEGDLFIESLARCMITPSSVMMRREVFDQIGLFDTHLPACEDYDLWLRLSLVFPVGLLNFYALTRLGGHPDQLSSIIPAQDRYRIYSLLKLLGFFKPLPQDDEFFVKKLQHNQIGPDLKIVDVVHEWVLAPKAAISSNHRHWQALQSMLQKKMNIYRKGCQKHNRQQEIEYLAAAGQWLEEQGFLPGPGG